MKKIIIILVLLATLVACSNEITPDSITENQIFSEEYVETKPESKDGQDNGEDTLQEGKVENNLSIYTTNPPRSIGQDYYNFADLKSASCGLINNYLYFNIGPDSYCYNLDNNETTMLSNTSAYFNFNFYDNRMFATVNDGSNIDFYEMTEDAVPVSSEYLKNVDLSSIGTPVIMKDGYIYTIKQDYETFETPGIRISIATGETEYLVEDNIKFFFLENSNYYYIKDEKESSIYCRSLVDTTAKKPKTELGIRQIFAHNGLLFFLSGEEVGLVGTRLISVTTMEEEVRTSTLITHEAEIVSMHPLGDYIYFNDVNRNLYRINIQEVNRETINKKAVFYLEPELVIELVRENVDRFFVFGERILYYSGNAIDEGGVPSVITTGYGAPYTVFLSDENNIFTEIVLP